MAQSRGIHYASAVLVGLGVGVILYRFAVLGLFWTGSFRWVFPAIGTGLIAAGAQLSRKSDRPRPEMASQISLAIVGIGAAMGLLYLAVPTLSRITLERREFPGFSFEVPTDKPTTATDEYAMGQVMYKQIGGANAVLSISWQGGGTTREDLEIGMKALAPSVGGGTATRTPIAGPDGKPIDTMSLDTDKGAPLRMSLLECGKRAVLVMSIGIEGIDTVHGRIVKSFRCTPDPAKEITQDGVVRVALTMPGWSASEKLPAQVTLTDGSAALIVRETNSSQENMKDLIVPLLNAFGGKLTAQAAVGDRVPFTGTLDGDPIVGWARRVTCPTHGVMLIAMANTAEESEQLYVASSNAGCLREGEAAPVWPDFVAPTPEAPAPE